LKRYREKKNKQRKEEEINPERRPPEKDQTKRIGSARWGSSKSGPISAHNNTTRVTADYARERGGGRCTERIAGLPNGGCLKN